MSLKDYAEAKMFGPAVLLSPYTVASVTVVSSSKCNLKIHNMQLDLLLIKEEIKGAAFAASHQSLTCLPLSEQNDQVYIRWVLAHSE